MNLPAKGVYLPAGPTRDRTIVLPLSSRLGWFRVEMFRVGNEIRFTQDAKLSAGSHEEGRKVLLQVLKGLVAEIERQAPSAPLAVDTVGAGGGL